MHATDLRSLLVDRAIVSAQQVHAANDVTRGSTTSWLEQLLLWGLLEEELVVRVVVADVYVPRCDLDRLARIPYDVLALVPADLALEHRSVPVWVEPDGDLRLCMVDPTDGAALNELEFFLHRHVLREVAPASAIAWALHSYYRLDSPLWPPYRRAPAARAAYAVSAADTERLARPAQVVAGPR